MFTVARKIPETGVWEIIATTSMKLLANTILDFLRDNFPAESFGIWAPTLQVDKTLAEETPLLIGLMQDWLDTMPDEDAQTA